MSITNFSLRRAVTVWMAVLVLGAAGLFAVFNLPLSLFPNLNLPVATVRTTWPGASPTEVEQQITSPLETEFQSLSDVAGITSTSAQGYSVIVVQFNFGADLAEKLNDIRSDVSAVQNQLPSGSDQPIVEQYNANSQPIMTLSLAGGGGGLTAISEAANGIVAPALQHLGGVGQINVNAGLVRQVDVTVDPAKLSYYHLGIQQVTQAIAASNFTAQVGQATRGNGLIPLQLAGQFTSVQQLAQIPVPVAHGAIRLGDVASVGFGNAEVTMLADVNGQPAVTLDVIESSTANTVQVSDEVHRALAGLSAQLPAGMRLTVLSDSAQVVRDSVSTVALHTFLGFLFGILVILLILRNLRTTAVVAIAIPIAMLTTFVLMLSVHVSLDTTTLGALAVGLGSLVDFSIVVLESIFRARQRGLPAREAAAAGTGEVGLAVFVGAVAQICVFGPAIFTPGIAGQFFSPIAMTVSFSHLAALLVAITVTPLLASRVLRPAHFERPEGVPGLDAPFRAWNPLDWSGRGMHALTEGYRRALAWALDHRPAVIGVSFALFLGSLVLVRSIGFQFYATVYQNQVQAQITAPQGTSLTATQQFADQVVQLARSGLPGLSSYYEVVGSQSARTGSATNVATVTFTLAPLPAAGLQRAAYAFQSVVSGIPGAQIQVTPVAESTGSVASNSLNVTVLGPDVTTLTRLSAQVATIMQGTPGLRDVSNSLESGLPTYSLAVNVNALRHYDLTELQVEAALRQAFTGYQASTFWQGDTPYSVIVQFPQGYARDIANLSGVTVVNSLGQQVPLSDLVSLRQSTELVTINHTNGVRSVDITATLYHTTPTVAQKGLTRAFRALRLPAGYSISYGIQGSFINSALRDLGLAFLAAVILLYVVMASLFESLLLPFVIMFSLPPTFVGAALGLFLTHRSLDINAMVGAIMVVGLVTNNAIVLVDYTNQLRAQGRSLRAALLEAGPVRLRPILMSSLTTVLAMLPLVLGFGTGASTLDAMATVLAGGLLLSTMVSLLLVPAMYVTLAREQSPAVAVPAGLPAQ